MWRGLGSVSIHCVAKVPMDSSHLSTIGLEHLVFLNVVVTFLSLPSPIKLLQTVLIFQWKVSIFVLSSNIVLLHH
jgi:hypothetical protein